jgi:hypothetical protein
MLPPSCWLGSWQGEDTLGFETIQDGDLDQERPWQPRPCRPRERQERPNWDGRDAVGAAPCRKEPGRGGVGTGSSPEYRRRRHLRAKK